MADSENSRTLPAITRRKMLYAPAIMAAATVPPGDALALPPPHSETDPVLVRWSEWEAAHAHYLRLSELRWDTELRLSQEARYPEVKIRLWNGRSVYALSEEEIDLDLRGPEMSRARAEAKAELAELTRRWNDADHRLGYSRALEAESMTAERRSALAQSLLSVPAGSVAGAAAKLDCFIAMNTPVAHYQKYLHPALRRLIKPDHPELRSILTDLVLIGGRADGLFRA